MIFADAFEPSLRENYKFSFSFAFCWISTLLIISTTLLAHVCNLMYMYNIAIDNLHV